MPDHAQKWEKGHGKITPKSVTRDVGRKNLVVYKKTNLTNSKKGAGL